MKTNSKCLKASQIDQFFLIEVRENQREKKKGKLIMTMQRHRQPWEQDRER
jgi:hypothetical protein